MESLILGRTQRSPAPLQGQATLSPADAQELLTGKMYINVHTKAHPAGEIRGRAAAAGTLTLAAHPTGSRSIWIALAIETGTRQDCSRGAP